MARVCSCERSHDRGAPTIGAARPLPRVPPEIWEAVDALRQTPARDEAPFDLALVEPTPLQRHVVHRERFPSMPAEIVEHEMDSADPRICAHDGKDHLGKRRRRAIRSSTSETAVSFGSTTAKILAVPHRR